MFAWRLTRRKHAASAFDGAGARRTGGRWNPKGAAIAYASEHLSLAALEYLVHVDPGDAPGDLVSIRIEIPDALVKTVDPGRLPTNWRTEPPPAQLAEIGRQWRDGGSSLALRVPSVLVPTEYNLLIDSDSDQLARCTSALPLPFTFDPRLLK